MVKLVVTDQTVSFFFEEKEDKSSGTTSSAYSNQKKKKTWVKMKWMNDADVGDLWCLRRFPMHFECGRKLRSYSRHYCVFKSTNLEAFYLLTMLCEISEVDLWSRLNNFAKRPLVAFFPDVTNDAFLISLKVFIAISIQLPLFMQTLQETRTDWNNWNAIDSFRLLALLSVPAGAKVILLHESLSRFFPSRGWVPKGTKLTRGLTIQDDPVISHEVANHTNRNHAKNLSDFSYHALHFFPSLHDLLLNITFAKRT